MDIGRTEGVSGTGRIEGKGIEKVNPPATQPTPAPQDRVEISQMGSLVSEVMSLPAMRVDKIAELKQAIEAGTYQTDEKLRGAIDRFLAEEA